MKILSLDAKPAEVLAYFYKKGGPQYLQEMLVGLTTARSSYVSREWLEVFARELYEVGLPAAAEVVGSYAETIRHQWELPCRLPWDCTNLRERWAAEMEEKRKAWEAKEKGPEGP
jgi:hypothetical protein